MSPWRPQTGATTPIDEHLFHRVKAGRQQSDIINQYIERHSRLVSRGSKLGNVSYPEECTLLVPSHDNVLNDFRRKIIAAIFDTVEEQGSIKLIPFVSLLPTYLQKNNKVIYAIESTSIIFI